jgi:hypothetical protein
MRNHLRINHFPPTLFSPNRSPIYERRNYFSAKHAASPAATGRDRRGGVVAAFPAISQRVEALQDESHGPLSIRGRKYGDVAQTSKSAVSPTSKSAELRANPQVGKPAIRQTWKSALRFAGSGYVTELMAKSTKGGLVSETMKEQPNEPGEVSE